MVDEATFVAVQEKLASRRQNTARAWRHEHYLAGTLYCGACQRRLLYSRNRGGSGGEYEYYVCLGKPLGLCEQPYYPLADLEYALERLYGRISFSETERTALKSDLLARIQDGEHTSAKARESASRTLEQLAGQERKLLAAHYADAISLELFQEEQARLRRERVAAERVRDTVETAFTTSNALSAWRST